jgi:tetratricopeptide (TPR) repeat protein
LALAIQMAEALEHAHGQHILHGDLKPSNILLTPSAKPMLLDFNLSQDYANSPAVCGGGTLPYMPPEHLRLVEGQAGPQEQSTFEPTADVYSFGALLYELLSGVTPVTLPSNNDDLSAVASLLLSAVEPGPPPIRRYNPLVSRRLESLILHCLAFDKNNRPATMAEVKQKLKTETRSLAAVGRFARVRPFLFASAVGLPLAILAGAAAHVAIQPPRYVSTYERGLQLASAGEFDDAIDYFAAAVDSNPSYAPARFQLARARMALGELDPAMNEFRQLARINNDGHSMAYLGYCFNLKEVPVAAIPWYERAIQSGAKTAAIYNNLAASYLEVPSQMTHPERLRLAGDYLSKALRLRPKSLAVQLNFVRHAVANAKLDPSYNPLHVWREAHSILAAAPRDPLIRLHVAMWYEALVRFETAHIRNQRIIGSADPEPDTSARESFAKLYQEMLPVLQDALPGGRRRSSALAETDNSSQLDGYYLEPLALDTTEP